MVYTNDCFNGTIGSRDIGVRVPEHIITDPIELVSATGRNHRLDRDTLAL